MWKTHPIYSNYQLNEEGQIRNIITNNIMNGMNPKNHQGYRKVTIYHEGRRYYKFVHRLMMETFEGIRNDMEVDHINGDKLDNRRSNLEYVTRAENARRAAMNGLYKSGDDVNTARISLDEVIHVCTCLSKGFTINETLELLNLCGSMRKIVRKIARRESWRRISDKYEWDTSRIYDLRKFDDSFVTEFINLMLDGYEPSDLCSIYHEYKAQRIRDLHKAIINGVSHRKLYEKIKQERSTTIEITWVEFECTR